MGSPFDQYVSCGCSHCSYCLIGCFHLLPCAVATLLLSQKEHAALVPAFASPYLGVPEVRQNCPRTLGRLLLEWSPYWCKLVDAPPVSIALPCTMTCAFETAVALRQNLRNRQVERQVFLLGRCREVGLAWGGAGLLLVKAQRYSPPQRGRPTSNSVCTRKRLGQHGADVHTELAIVCVRGSPFGARS